MTISNSESVFDVHLGTSSARVPEAVLFPFDTFCVPFARGMRVELQSPTKEGVVVPRGPQESCDAHRVQFNGTVIRIGDEFKMWYLGLGDREGEEGFAHDLFVCHATSRDGVHWEKPDLGLVEYGGDKKNNRVRINGLQESDRVYMTIVLHEPEDPDPERRFKMAIEIPRYHGQLAVATSADGLDWYVSPANPVGPLTEFSGLTKVGDCYILSGQGGTACGRTMEVLASYDFEHWTMAPAIGLRKEQVAYDSNRPVNPWMPAIPLPITREIHLGASLWNRGNVILGVYGDMHWNPQFPGERKHCRINLGLLTSPDGLHYREPLPDFPLISAAENWRAPTEWDARLLQGQAFENVGEKTFFWHGVAHGGVHLATWPRDQIGCLRMHEHGNRRELTPILGPPHFLTCPVTPGQDGAGVFLNVELASKHAEAKVELCDEQFRPLPDYSGDNAIPVTESGLRVPVRWKGGNTAPGKGEAFRVRVEYCGIRPEDVRVFAVYVADGSG